MDSKTDHSKNVSIIRQVIYITEVLTMPPRKRIKGRERKAKKAEKKAEKERETEARELKEIGLAVVHAIWSSRASGMDGVDNEDGTRSMIRKITCDHGCGCDLTRNDLVDHPVSTFLDDLFLGLDKCSFVYVPLMEGFERHREVWSNAGYRKMGIDTLISIGTNELLIREQDANTSQTLLIAQCIRILGNYNGVGRLETMMPRRDLEIGSGSNMRDALKFYRKRTSCKCLKKLHLEARKSIPKLGQCSHCEEEKERASLSVCSVCKVSQYCSRDCQVAGWPKHKVLCKHFVRMANRSSRGTLPLH